MDSNFYNLYMPSPNDGDGSQAATPYSTGDYASQEATTYHTDFPTSFGLSSGTRFAPHYTGAVPFDDEALPFADSKHHGSLGTSFDVGVVNARLMAVPQFGALQGPFGGRDEFSMSTMDDIMNGEAADSTHVAIPTASPTTSASDSGLSTPYYSCSYLSDTNSVRRIRASTVRSQIDPPAHSFKERTFQNNERLPLPTLDEVAEAATTAPSTLGAPPSSTPSLLYYPVTNAAPWRPRTKVGAARAVYTEDTRDRPDVIYHDKTAPRMRPGQRWDSFSVAPLRPAKKSSRRLKQHEDE